MRRLHGSEAITTAIHCSQIVFSTAPRSGDMHFLQTVCRRARIVAAPVGRNRFIAPMGRAASVAALDPVAQISLFGKLKLPNCANFTRVENRSGFLFVWSGAIVGAPHSPSKTGVNALVVGVRSEGNVRAATRAAPLRPTIPGIVLWLIFVVIHARSRRFVVDSANKIPERCNFHCSLQRPVLILQENFGREGSRTMLVCKRNEPAPDAVTEIDERPRAAGPRQACPAFWPERNTDSRMETSNRNNRHRSRGRGELASQPPSLCRQKVATTVPGPLCPAVGFGREYQ